LSCCCCLFYFYTFPLALVCRLCGHSSATSRGPSRAWLDQYPPRSLTSVPLCAVLEQLLEAATAATAAFSISRAPSLRYHAPPTLCLFFFSCRWAVATRRAAPKVSTAPVVPTWAGESEPRPKAPLPAAGTRRGSRTRQLLRHECRSRTRLGSGYAQSCVSHPIEPSMNLLPVTSVRRSNQGSRSAHRGPSDGTTDNRCRSPIGLDARRWGLDADSGPS